MIFLSALQTSRLVMYFGVVMSQMLSGGGMEHTIMFGNLAKRYESTSMI